MRNQKSSFNAMNTQGKFMTLQTLLSLHPQDQNSGPGINLLLRKKPDSLEMRDLNIKRDAIQSRRLNRISNSDKVERNARDSQQNLKKHYQWRLTKLNEYRDSKKLRFLYQGKKRKISQQQSRRRLLAVDMTGSTCSKSYNSGTRKTEVKLISQSNDVLCSFLVNNRNSTDDNFEFIISATSKAPFTISINSTGLIFKNNLGTVIDFNTANKITPIEILENKITVKFNGYNLTAIRAVDNQWSLGFYTSANFTAIDPTCIFQELIPVLSSSSVQGVTTSTTQGFTTSTTQGSTTSTTQGLTTSTTQRVTNASSAPATTSASLKLPQLSYRKICNSTAKGLITQEFTFLNGQVDPNSTARFISEFNSDNKTSFNYSFNSFKIEIKDGSLKFLNISNSQNLLEFGFNGGVTKNASNGYNLSTTSPKKYQVRNNLGELIDLEFSSSPDNIKIIDQSGDGYLLNISSNELGRTKIVTNAIINGSLVGSCQVIDYSQQNFQASTINRSISLIQGNLSFGNLTTSSNITANPVMINSSKEGSNGLALFLNNQRTASVELSQREESKDFKFNFTINNKTFEFSIDPNLEIGKQISNLQQQITISGLALNCTNSNGNISLSFATQDLGNVNLIINKNPNNNKFNLAFYQDANPLDNFQGITEQDFILAKSLYQCSKNIDIRSNKTVVVVADKEGDTISSYSIPTRNDQSSHYNVSLIISKRPTTISIDPVNKAVKITNSSGQVINNPGISVLGGIYPINRDLNLSISLVNGLYSCAYVDSRNIKIDDQCLTSENSFPPKPSTCKMQSLGFVIGNDLVTDFNASGNAVYVKDFDAFLSAQDGKISLKKGGGEVLFSFNNSGLESNSLGGNLTTITENNYKLLDNQGNQLSLLFEKNNNQISLKLLKANGDGVQYNLTRDANLETYNIAGIVANQFITECSESQFINLPTTSTTSAQATTSTTSAQATTSTSSARETTAEVRQIQRTCNQTITDQHVQQNFYNDGNLFLSINASKNASVGKNTSISFAIGSSKIDFTFNPSQTIEQIASFFKKHFELKGYQVETELNPSNPNQTIISFQNLNPANTSLIITKNSGNITYQLAVNGTIINQCNLLTTNIVSQILEITSTSLNFTSSIPASTSSSVVVTTATSKTINDCDLRGNGVIQKTNGQDQFEVSKNRDSIEFKFLKSNKTLSFYNSTLRVDNSIQLFPYNFSDNNFNYTATNVFGNLKIIRNDGLEILINESGVVVSPDKDTKICNFENTKDKTTTIFDPTTNSITTSITSNGDTTTTSQNYTSAQVINATLLCLENDKFDNYSEFMSYLKDKNDQMPKNLVNISSSKFSSIVYNLKKALKDDNEIIKILNGINTSYCNRTDFIERIQKIDDILKAKKSQGSSRPNIAVPIAVPSALFVLAAFWAVTTKNPVQKLRNGFTVLTNFLSPNSATTTVARNDARGDFVYSEQLRPPAAEVSSSLSTTGINFGNPDLELGLPRRERGGLWGSVLRTLAGLYCLSNANGFQMAKESRDLYGNILQTKNLYSLSLTPAQLTLQGLDQRSLQEASPAFASNFASKGGFKFENEGFKFEFDQGSKNFILKDSLGNIKARCDETGEIIDSARTGRQRNPKLKLSKFGNMNLRYSHDDKAKKMTILDENKNGFQITFIGENILSSAVEEGRIISENFNGILIDHLLNEAKDFTFQDQKVLKTTILDHGIIIQKNPGNLMVFLFNEDRTGFNLDNFAEVINESNEHNDGFIFSPPNPDSPNKISFQIAGQDFYILVDQDTKQFSLYDSLDNKLESPSNKIIEDEQSLISITQDQVEFEITIDKDNVSIYSLINTLITPSNNYDFATRITMVSSNKLDFEEGYILNPQIINKFLDSICKLSGNDQVIASYVKSIKSILDDRSLSDKGNILTIFKNIDDYLQFNNFVLVGLFESTQEIFIKKNQAEIQAKSEAELQAMIISQDQSKSLQEVISQSMQSTFDQHISREVDISQEAEEYLASLPKVAQQSVLDKQEYVSVARSRIRGIKKENKFGMLNSNQSNNHEYYDDSEYGSYIEDYDDDYSLVDESLQKDYDLIDDDRSDISTAEFEEPAEDDDQVAKYGSYRDALLKEDKNPLITSSISKEREQQLAELERKIPDLISKIERLDLLRKQQLKYVHGRPENGVKAINRREESYKSYFKSLKINRAQDKLLSQFNLIVESILRENPNSKSAIEASKYIDIIRADKDIDNKHPFFDNASLTQRNKIKEIVDKKLSQYKILQRESKIQERKWGKLSVSALKAKSGDQPKEPNTLEVSKAKGKALSPSNEKGSISDR